MAYVISFANQKGGVAKTTTTHNIGVALASRGKRVLMIDLDSQASLTISSGIEPMDIKNNIVTVLDKGKVDVKSCIVQNSNNLDIITSIIDLASLEMEMLSRASREKILARALEQIKEEYDYILIDCPPQLSILTINALSASDGVLVPVKTDYLAYRGLEQLMDTVEEIHELINPDLEVLGMIATMFKTRSNADKELLSGMKEKYKVICTIKESVEAKKGIYDGLAVVESKPENDVAVAYNQLADMIISNNYKREDV